jgi:glycerol uptake facilitator-like aquaporin
MWAAYAAEGLGTFGLVFAGCGAIMIDTLSHGAITHVGVGLVFGLIITVMIYAFGHISDRKPSFSFEQLYAAAKAEEQQA